MFQSEIKSNKGLRPRMNERKWKHTFTLNESAW
jgi:hypothetical protein